MAVKKKIVLDDKPTFELDNYDIHKQLYAQMEPNQEKIGRQLTSIGAWFSAKYPCKFWMCMCKEISWYTVFHLKGMNYEKAKEELRKTLEFRGTIVDIEYVHAEDAYECWIKNPEGEIEMYYLFPYDWGVVEID